jgi:hypothetical protein
MFIRRDRKKTAHKRKEQQKLQTGHSAGYGNLYILTKIAPLK